MGYNKAVIRGKFIAIQSYVKKKNMNRQPNFTLKTSGKRRRRTAKTQKN